MHSIIQIFAAFTAISSATATGKTVVGGQQPILSTGSACTLNNGIQGECTLVSDCIAQGGTPEPGHCPGGSDIQCCAFNTEPACPPPDLNEESISRLKGYEGFVKDVTPDPVGLPSIGYGHKCTQPGCAEVTYPIPLSEGDATSLLMYDLQTFQKCIVKKLGSLTLNDNQYGALASFTFNEGCASLETSTLARRLLVGEDPNTVVEEEFPRWVYGGRPPRVLPVLVSRRKDEIKLFQLPSDVQALPVEC